MSSTSRIVRIFGKSVRWQRGVTNIIFWIYVYGYFLSSRLHLFRLRRVDMLSFSSFFLVCCQPTVSPPSLFSVCYIFVDIVSMLSFSSCHDRPMPYFHTPLNGFPFPHSPLCHVFQLLLCSKLSSSSSTNRESRRFWWQIVPTFPGRVCLVRDRTEIRCDAPSFAIQVGFQSVVAYLFKCQYHEYN